MSDSASPSSAPDTAPRVRIDRLVLDIPGLEANQASRLAQDIAQRLSKLGLSGEYANLGVSLDPIDGTRADLASRIVAALAARLA